MEITIVKSNLRYTRKDIIFIFVGKYIVDPVTDDGDSFDGNVWGLGCYDGKRMFWGAFAYGF